MEKEDEKKEVKHELDEKELNSVAGGGWYESGSFGTRGGAAFYNDPSQQAGYVDPAKQRSVVSELVYNERN